MRCAHGGKADRDTEVRGCNPSGCLQSVRTNASIERTKASPEITSDHLRGPRQLSRDLNSLAANRPSLLSGSRAKTSASSSSSRRRTCFRPGSSISSSVSSNSLRPRSEPTHAPMRVSSSSLRNPFLGMSEISPSNPHAATIASTLPTLGTTAPRSSHRGQEARGCDRSERWLAPSWDRSFRTAQRGSSGVSFGCP